MRNITLEGKTGEDYLNVWNDAVTKQSDAGGLAGLRKINKVIAIFDEIATLSPTKILCQECAKELGMSMDIYKLKEDKVNFWIEDDLWNFIKASYDKIQWNSTKSKLVVASLDYLDSFKEAVPPKLVAQNT